MLQTETAPRWRQTETKILSGLRSLLEADCFTLRLTGLFSNSGGQAQDVLGGFSTIALPATLKFDYASQNRSICLTSTVN